MELPSDTSLPFFSYGTLKPGQVGFHLIEDLVEGDPSPATVEGVLWEQDGLPIYVKGHGKVRGYVLGFTDENEAYSLISDYETDRNYEWGTTEPLEVEIDRANILVAADPDRGRTDLIDDEWTTETDPLFSDALDVIKDVINEIEEETDYKETKNFFRLQMAYLLLWSSIERYNSFKFGLSDRSSDNRTELANTESFQSGLSAVIPEHRMGMSVYSADYDKSYTLEPNNPEESIDYYYQVRSNLVHRGKTSREDYQIMRDSLEELYEIFRYHVLGE